MQLVSRNPKSNIHDDTYVLYDRYTPERFLKIFSSFPDFSDENLDEKLCCFDLGKGLLLILPGRLECAITRPQSIRDMVSCRAIWCVGVILRRYKISPVVT